MSHTPPMPMSLQNGLCVAVCGVQEQDITGEVVRSFGEGVETLFSRHEGPELPLGQTIQLTFFSADHRPRMLRGTPTLRHDSAGYRRYSFRFEESEEVRQGFLRMFNQRRAFRVDAGVNPPIDVHLTDAASDPARSVPSAALLRSISSTGVGLAANAAIDLLFAKVESVRLRMTLPPLDSSLNLMAWIRNRRLQDQTVFYGLEFDPQRTVDYEAQEQIVLQYVMRRQREELQQRLR